MPEGTRLGVDAYGVSDCTRSYKQENLLVRHSFVHYCEGKIF